MQPACSYNWQAGDSRIPGATMGKSSSLPNWQQNYNELVEEQRGHVHPLNENDEHLRSVVEWFMEIFNAAPAEDKPSLANQPLFPEGAVFARGEALNLTRESAKQLNFF